VLNVGRMLFRMPNAGQANNANSVRDSMITEGFVACLISFIQGEVLSNLVELRIVILNNKTQSDLFLVNQVR
jgi:hypothetical protein